MSALPLKAIGCLLPSKTTQPMMVVTLFMVDLICNMYHTFIRASDNFIFNSWKMVHYEVPNGSSNLSLVSSKPPRMCLCEDEEPDCFNVLTNDTRYPGETFTISAVVVGQGFGTADGSVYAQFLPLNEDSPPSFNELQQSQKVNHKSCRKLKYTVLSSNAEDVIVLTANSIVVSEYLDPLYVESSVQLYKHLQVKQYNTGFSYLAVYQIQGLLSFPVYINVTFLPCPPGFMLSNKSAKCIVTQHFEITILVVILTIKLSIEKEQCGSTHHFLGIKATV